MSVHDPRSQTSAAKLSLPGKVYSLSLTDNKVVVATADRHIQIFDIRNMQHAPLEKRESPLKYQTRTVSCFLDGSAFAVGSVEVRSRVLCLFSLMCEYYFLIYCCVVLKGRVAVEYFNEAVEQDVKEGGSAPRPGYTFKCHRRGELAFPVNAIAFHPIYGNESAPLCCLLWLSLRPSCFLSIYMFLYLPRVFFRVLGTFATGGCDGTVSCWDGFSKKRLCQLHQYPTSISSISFRYLSCLSTVIISMHYIIFNNI